jgi:hypothetical protein
MTKKIKKLVPIGTTVRSKPEQIRHLGSFSLSPASGLALQLPFREISESMGNHDSKIVGAGSVD